MNVDVVFAGIAVSDFLRARSWYERFFGRPADVISHDHEVMWKGTETAWIYIVRDEARAGYGLVALAVSDLDGETSVLLGRGLTVGPAEPVGDSGRKAVVIDPDGNSIALIQVASAGATR